MPAHRRFVKLTPITSRCVAPARIAVREKQTATPLLIRQAWPTTSRSRMWIAMRSPPQQCVIGN